MTQVYKYGTVLRALDDDPHPNNDLEKGDIILEAGKLEDGDSYKTFNEKNEIAMIRFETVAVYEADEYLSENEAKEFAKERYLEEEEVSG